MEGIIDINKDKYFDKCKEIVKNELTEIKSDELLNIVTNEIMDTCLFVGGDFQEENVKEIAKQYVIKGALNRIKAIHGGLE